MKIQFRDLLSSDSLQLQFEDFLVEKYDYVKDMKEKEFMQFMINEEFGQSYDDLIR